MRRFAMLAGCALLAALLVQGCPASQAEIFVHDGLERTYYTHVPASYDGETPMPLVLVLHGGGGSARHMQRGLGLNAIAEQRGFIVAYPEGIDNKWSDGRAVLEREGIDDVGFLFALINELSAEYAIDPARIYMTGASNGGHMTYRFACEHADVLAAAAPLIAGMPVEVEENCSPNAPLPMLIINGTDDPLVPYEGGPVGFGRQNRGVDLSAEATAALWAGYNGCEEAPTETLWPDADPDDGTRVREFAYECGNAPVTLYAIEGGGHTLPGGAQYLPRFLIGPMSNEFETGEVLAEFFLQFSRVGGD